MGNDRLEGSKPKKRGLSEEVTGEDLGSKKLKSNEERTESPMAKLPVELLYSIHLYAKNPAFTMLNRHFHTVFSLCPISIKAAYLIARWHEAYCYGFYSPTKGKSRKTKTAAAAAATSQDGDKADDMLSTLSRDLLQGGSIVELSWPSRFLPVIPLAEWPHPLSLSSQRSVDHFILDACLRYPLCNHEVLRAVEDIVLASSEFGNIVLTTGLWRREGDSELCTYESFHSKESDAEPQHIKPCHLMVSELPKRLFRGFDKETLEEVVGNGSKLAPELVQHLEVFGSGPLPASPSLLLLLEIISLHLAYSLESYTVATNPVNSFEGLPLAKSTFQKSQFMVQFLLYFGAEPSQTQSLCLYLAIRSGWLQGLQMMVERDAVKLEAWKRAIGEIRLWYQRNEERRHGRNHNPEAVEDDEKGKKAGEAAQHPPNAISSKRRRLADRIHMNTNMLKEAVKHNQWAIANWIRSKDVAPDIRTIQLLEMKQRGTQ